MARPILRLATRVTRRSRATAWAIAFACTVLVGSLSLADGLSNGIDSVTSRIQSGPALYSRDGELLRSQIDPEVFASIPGNSLALRAHPAELEVNGVTVSIALVALVEYLDGEGATLFPTGATDISLDIGLRSRIEAASGSPVGSNGTLRALGRTLTGLPIVGPPPVRAPLFPDDWAYVRADLLIAMNSTRGGPVQAILVEQALDPDRVRDLGLVRLDPVGAIGFVRGGIGQVQASLRILALLVAVVIGLLVYAAMSLEVHQRAREIRILRSLGASPRTVARVYEGRALLLALVGGMLGAAQGIVAAHAIVSFAPLAGLPNLVILDVPAEPVASALLVAVLAASLGGLVPSRRAAALVRSKGAVRS